MSNSKTFSFKKNNRRAFTLIELSIVLIIIGLLIVAITSGSSLIRNAKLRSITNEAKQYQVAVNSFFMKFDKYPGDFDESLGGDSVQGTGDDIIQWHTSGDINEGSNTWLQLIAAGILPTDIRSSMTTAEMMDATSRTLRPNTHFPPSAENSAGWIFNSRPDNNVTINYVQLVKSFTSQFEGGELDSPAIDGTAGGSLTATDAYSIDNKNDDGVRNSGDIREVFTITTGAGNDCDSADDVTATNNYDLDNQTADVCSLAFKVTIN
ncbi:prepilin-type N-terminal cleavage/methylation domain-containing protein [Rickettsiales bacterium]|nr:prepilin-type N-terminal cleavage/methylation domain-containing protein [Rickettsiales bacterium]